MLAGELYDPAIRNSPRPECGPAIYADLNATARTGRTASPPLLILRAVRRGGDTGWMQPPCFCDYGRTSGWGAIFAFNCVVFGLCP